MAFGSASPCFPSQVNPREFKRQVKQEDILDLYNHMKNKYLSQTPVPQYYDIIDGLSKDTGLPKEWVVKMLDSNKLIRNVSTAQYLANRSRAQILGRAKIEAQYINQPRLAQALMTVNDLYRQLYTAYHFAVFPFTHAQSLGEMFIKGGRELFSPAAWKNPGRNLYNLTQGTREFFNMVGRAYGYAANPTFYRQQMTDLMINHPRYDDWVKVAGHTIEVGAPPRGILAPKAPSRSLRAWDALKPSRLALMDGEIWDSATGKIRPQFANLDPAELKEVMQNVASRYAHITGSIVPGELRLPYHSLWFAPDMTVSKYLGTIGDAAKAIKLASKGPSGWTAADRKFISLTTRTMASVFAGHLGAMAINRAWLPIQQMIGGPKQDINFDPTRPGDWLAFKFWGHKILPRGLIEAVQVTNRLFQAMRGVSKQSKEEVVGSQLEYKLSPGASTALELTSGTDVFGRPVPWSSQAYGTGQIGARKFVDPTKPRYTYPEYILQHGPIFWNEAVREFYAGLRENNIDPHSAIQIIRGIQQHPGILGEAGATMAGTFVGLGIQPDYYSDEAKAKREVIKAAAKATPEFQAQKAALQSTK